MTIDEIQDEHFSWAQHNFPDADVTQAVLGVCEEAGELAHAHLKSLQNIRGTLSEHSLELQDAIGDIVIYLLHICNLHGWSLDQIIDDTWRTVKKRDWIKFPEDGRTK